MTGFVEDPCRTFQAGGALSPWRLVKLSAGVLAYAGATDEAIGSIERPTTASGDYAPVRLKNATGTRFGVAAGAFAVGAVLYQAANGKIDDTGSKRVGIALEAATNDGDEVEFLPDFGAAGGTQLVTGEVTLDGSNATPIATGLATIVSAGVTLKSSAAPGLDPTYVTHDFSGADGTLNVYAWKPTSSGNPTLIASTNNTFVVSYWAVGTK